MAYKDYLLVAVLQLADGGEHWEDRCESFASEADAERGAKKRKDGFARTGGQPFDKGDKIDDRHMRLLVAARLGSGRKRRVASA